MKKLQMNKKLLFIIPVSVLLAIVVITIIGTSSASIDTASFLIDQEVDNLEFVNPTFDNEILKVTVHNPEESNYNLKTIDVKFLDTNGDEITTIKGYIGNIIKPNDAKQLVVQTDVDLSNTAQIKYIVNK